MNTPYTLGVDIDSVIADTTGLMLMYLNQRFHHHLAMEDLKQYRLQDNRGIDEKQVLEALDWFWHDGLLTVVPIEHAIEVLNSWALRNRIVLITARPPVTETPTGDWLSRYHVPFDQLIFAKNKVEWSKRVDVMIEDNLETAEAFAQKGVITLLLSYPWNTRVSEAAYSHLILRCASWRDVQSQLTNITQLLDGQKPTNTATHRFPWRRSRIYFGDERGLFISASDLVLERLVESIRSNYPADQYEVYDLCCGNGIATCVWGTNGYRATGMDIDPGRIAFANLNKYLLGLHHVKFICQDVRQWHPTTAHTGRYIVHVDTDWGIPGHSADAADLHEMAPDNIELVSTFLNGAAAVILRAPSATNWRRKNPFAPDCQEIQCHDLETGERYVYLVHSKRGVVLPSKIDVTGGA